MTKALLRADWVAPMDRPAFRDGGVVLSAGRILAVGSVSSLRQAHDRSIEEHDLGASVLLPGLVNPHVHLELSDLARGDRPAGFEQWLLDVIARTAPAAPDEASVRQATRLGVEQCLRFGVTTVGDISRQCAITRQVLAPGPLRAVSYGEVLAMAQRRGLLESRLAAAANASNNTDYLRIGVSPHAPYSVEVDGYRRCLEVARQHGLPLATHLAESSEEAEFLSEHAGAFRRLWEQLGAWDDSVPRFTGGPVRLAHALGLLDYPGALLAHVNYCDDEGMNLLAGGRASVVYCPRTHAFFGHPPHRWRDMLARGVNVAVGTDSCASSPDLNLVDDLRLIRRLAPEPPAHEIWELATTRAAKALGMADQVGTLAVGKSADVVAFPGIGDDPLNAILREQVRPTALWVGGEWVY
jgi:cytosine/adenosine deaminase-related metal-dependent hydrolase